MVGVHYVKMYITSHKFNSRALIWIVFKLSLPTYDQTITEARTYVIIELISASQSNCEYIVTYVSSQEF